MASDISITGVGSVSGFAGTPTKFKIHMGGLNVSLLTVAFDGPVKPECLLSTCKDGSVDCTYQTPIAGDYIIHITFDEEHVEGSPFHVKMKGENELTTELVKVSGRGIKEGRTRVNNEVIVDPTEAGITCSLQVSMEGPGKPEIIFQNNPNGTTTVKYKPSNPGMYKLNLKYVEKHVPGSPFSIMCK